MKEFPENNIKVYVVNNQQFRSGLPDYKDLRYEHQGTDSSSTSNQNSRSNISHFPFVSNPSQLDKSNINSATSNNTSEYKSTEWQ